MDITSVTNGTESGTQQVTVTITDDDPTPTVTLGVDTTSISEAGGVATLTATLSAVSGQNVTVDLGFSSTATLVDDYTASRASIVVLAGSPTGSITLTAVQDSSYEGTESITVDIVSVTNGTELGSQQLSIAIIDDDAQPRRGSGGNLPTPAPIAQPGASGSTTAPMGPDGGQITAGSLTVSFPPGALGKQVEMTVSIGNNIATGITPPPGTTLLPKQIEVTPGSPIALRKPVTLVITLTQADITAAGGNISNILVAVVTPSGVQTLPVKIEGTTLVVTVEHFSTFVLLRATQSRPILLGPAAGSVSPDLGTTLNWANPRGRPSMSWR